MTLLEFVSINPQLYSILNNLAAFTPNSEELKAQKLTLYDAKLFVAVRISYGYITPEMKIISISFELRC